MVDEGSACADNDALAKQLRHAAYGCWLTSVRASGADADARDIRVLAADAAGVVDEVMALCRTAGVTIEQSTLERALSTLATAKAEADFAADEAMTCWHRARDALAIARKAPSSEAFTAVTREHHPAYEAMERAQAAKERATTAVKTIRQAVVAVVSATTFDSTLQPSADLLEARAASLGGNEDASLDNACDAHIG